MKRPDLLPPAFAALILMAFALAAPASAADGEMRWGLHVTLAKWLDPAETEAFNTPFMVRYAVHDALVKPMPGGLSQPSLAESWQESKDRLTYTFTIRKDARFHNGEPVNAEDVKFIWGVGPRVEESGANLIPGFAYSAPMEDLKLKAR
jgi:ABC-type transport system substrate-binding protein